MITSAFEVGSSSLGEEFCGGSSVPSSEVDDVVIFIVASFFVAVDSNVVFWF
jgi:hypothetical protein